MKNRILIVLVMLVCWLCCVENASAQVIVPEKPQPPTQYMIPPPKPGSDFVLIPGHWVWAREQKMYVWVVPGWVPQKEGEVWVAGYWKEVPKGWKWIPGYWEKVDKKRWFFW